MPITEKVFVAESEGLFMNIFIKSIGWNVIANDTYLELEKIISTKIVYEVCMRFWILSVGFSYVTWRKNLV